MSDLFSVQTADDNTTQILGDGRPVIDALVGEELVVGHIGQQVLSVTQQSGPTATIDGSTITINSQGRHRFMVKTVTGMHALNVVGCEASTVDRIMARLNPAHGRNEKRARRVLRNMATEADGFDGSESSMPVNLALYGADSGTWAA